MNLKDPRNIVLTIPEGFDFCLKEYQKVTGCIIEPIEVPLSSINELVDMVTAKFQDKNIPVTIESWNPLLFSKKLRGFDGGDIVERFSVMALRVKGKLESDSTLDGGNVKKLISSKVHSFSDDNCL